MDGWRKRKRRRRVGIEMAEAELTALITQLGISGLVLFLIAKYLATINDNITALRHDIHELTMRIDRLIERLNR